jgi:hypothetical protein
MKNKPHWYIAFEREQLNTQQMERQKFYGGLERGRGRLRRSADWGRVVITGRFGRTMAERGQA